MPPSHTKQKGTPETAGGTQTATETRVRSPRRTSRVSKRKVNFGETEDSHDELSGILASVDKSPSKKKGRIVLRRNPSRDAAQNIQPAFNVPGPEEVLERAFSPFRDGEINKWHGWAEVESEPSFFTHILKNFGVTNGVIKEIFSLDDETFQSLPNPIYGLVFLYQFRGDLDDDADTKDCPDEVWFANQTTANACATVALLNIAMNCDELKLTDSLQKFKAQAQNLAPALRGLVMSTNDEIRASHNSFARRIDILNSDLALKNEYDDRDKKRRAPSKKSSKKVKMLGKDAAFHYIAYVSAGSKVWELDGLVDQPLCLGDDQDGNWLYIARDRILARIAETDSDGGYNLLALCDHPIPTLRRKLAGLLHTMIVTDEVLSRRFPNEWPSRARNDRCLDLQDADALLRYGLDTASVLAASLEDGWISFVEDDDFSLQRAVGVWKGLEMTQLDVRDTLEMEFLREGEEGSRINGRQKDYTPAIHGWISKLAEMGILKELKEEAEQSR